PPRHRDCTSQGPVQRGENLGGHNLVPPFTLSGTNCFWSERCITRILTRSPGWKNSGRGACRTSVCSATTRHPNDRPPSPESEHVVPSRAPPDATSSSLSPLSGYAHILVQLSRQSRPAREG